MCILRIYKHTAYKKKRETSRLKSRNSLKIPGLVTALVTTPRWPISSLFVAPGYRLLSLRDGDFIFVYLGCGEL